MAGGLAFYEFTQSELILESPRGLGQLAFQPFYIFGSGTKIGCLRWPKRNAVKVSSL